MGVLERLRRKLIVSCQVNEEEPIYPIVYRGERLYGPRFIVALAKQAEIGGAGGLRIEGPENIEAVSSFVKLPIIGLWKRKYPDSDVVITPTYREAEAVVKAGADVVALDATTRRRPLGEVLGEIIKRIRREYGVEVIGDVSTLEEGVMAEEEGVDAVATTLAGYTPYSRLTAGPDLELVRRLSEVLSIPVICEGRVRNPDDAARAFEAGAYAVVVGTAITRPYLVVREFVKRIESLA